MFSLGTEIRHGRKEVQTYITDKGVRVMRFSKNTSVLNMIWTKNTHKQS